MAYSIDAYRLHGRVRRRRRRGGTPTTTTTSKFVGTQPPGDYWSWTITTDSSGSGNFTAVNNTKSLNYSGSVTPLTGNSAGISKMVITSTTDTNLTTPASAYAIEVPNTALMAATAPFITDNNTELSLHPPIFAAAQGSCPSTGADLIWITMPSASWCPSAGSNNPQGNGCPSADNAYGTASISVSGGTYTVNVTPNKLDGSQGSGAFTLSGCTCSEGVIQCTDSNSKPVRIAFTPSGVFFVDTSDNAIAGIVQPDTNIDLADFLKNGRSFKGLRYVPLDSLASVGVVQNTQPASVTADGTQLNAHPFSDIDNGTLSTEGGTINFNNASQPLPGLIRAKFTSACGSTSDIVMAVRRINDKYVGLLITHSPCTTFDVGFNALMSEQ